MKIKMFSDTICGWCYIGKKRLDDALSQSNLSVTSVTHLPFQLNPQMPRKGMSRLDYVKTCLLYTSPSPRDRTRSRMPSSA